MATPDTKSQKKRENVQKNNPLKCINVIYSETNYGTCCAEQYIYM